MPVSIWMQGIALQFRIGKLVGNRVLDQRDMLRFGVSLATSNHAFRFAVSYSGKKLGIVSIALSVSPWAIVQLVS